jgi:hypothetical protein
MHTQRLALIVIAALLATAPSVASSQPRNDRVLLTSGIVKHVDVATATIVLDSGRTIRARAILLGDQFVAIEAVKTDDLVFVSGIDLGDEASGLPRALAK